MFTTRRSAEALEAAAPAENGVSQPAARSLNPNPYFGEDDEEVEKFEEEVRAPLTAAKACCHCELSVLRHHPAAGGSPCVCRRRSGST